MKPTSNELRYLARRRAGLTQADAAWVRGTTVWAIYREEHGETPVSGEVVTGEPVTDFEMAHLKRRRAGWTVVELARRLNTSHVTLIRWERGEGDYERLTAWWDARV